MLITVPPAGPWVYDSSLPKPDNLDSISDLIEFSRSDVGIKKKTYGLEMFYNLLKQFKLFDNNYGFFNNTTILAPDNKALDRYASTLFKLNKEQKQSFVFAHILKGKYTYNDFRNLAKSNKSIATVGGEKLNFFIDKNDELLISFKNKLIKLKNKDFISKN